MTYHPSPALRLLLAGGTLSCLALQVGCSVYHEGLLEQIETEPESTGMVDQASEIDPFQTLQESLIDDFDDVNRSIEDSDGRAGAWMAYHDGTEDAVMTPGPGDPFSPTETEELGNFALRVQGTGFRGWGVGFFTHLSERDDHVEPYGLLIRGYNAIRFRAKRSSDSSTILRVAIADETSSMHGSCPEDACTSDHAEGVVALQTDWTEYIIPFSDLSKMVGADVDLDRSYELHVRAEGENIDFWVDDLTFIELEQPL